MQQQRPEISVSLPVARFAPGVWLARHVQAALFSLGQLLRAPMSTLLTCAVMAVALSLPGGLHLLLENARQLSGAWQNQAQVSVFLERGAEERTGGLADELRQQAGIDTVRVITPTQALQEFSALSGLSESVLVLEENPLPAVLVLDLETESADAQSVEGLVEQLSARPEVDLVQVDLEWLKRLQAIAHILTRGIVVLAGVLALGILLIVGNTIRLSIESRHDEIEVAKLVGATDAFIRRPFLYRGVWYGLFSGLLAVALIGIGVAMLRGPVNTLTELYHSDFALANLSMRASMILILLGIFLGLVGSWMAVGRHLHRIEPT